MIKRKLIFSLLSTCAFVAIPNIANASALSSVTIDWSTLTITANGNNVTNSLNWINQFDSVDTNYIEGALSGPSVSNNHDVDPNPDWATIQNTSDGQVTSIANTALSNNLVRVSTVTNYTGRAESSIFRHGEFIADAGVYTFNVDYSVSGEINALNSETGGGRNSLSAFSYAELFVNNVSAGSDSRGSSFFFDFDDTVFLDSFGSIQNSGTLSAIMDFNDNAFNFLDGDLITIDVTAQTDSRSFSRIPAPVPIPPAIALFVSALGFLYAKQSLQQSAKKDVL